LVIDPQVIFADPASEWAVSEFERAMRRVTELATDYAGRIIVTRWVPQRPHLGSWKNYFEQWQFADRAPDDSYFDLMPAAAELDATVVSVPTFNKWGAELSALTGETPQLVLTGVATCCCVLSTALAAADAGAHVTVIADGCADSTPENHAMGLNVMRLYEPQIVVR
jgi:nicotinamidase-related amidase